MYTNNIYSGKKNTLIDLALKYLLPLCFLLLTPMLAAAEKNPVTETTITFSDNDTELTASCFITGSKDIVVFLPTAYAPLEDQLELSREITQNGLSSCFSHVFSDLFMPLHGKYYQDIPLRPLLSLLREIQRATQKAVYFSAHGAGNKVAYALAHQTLADGTPASEIISGLILLSPNLLADTPKPGQAQQYLTLIHEKNLAGVYLPTCLFTSSLASGYLAPSYQKIQHPSAPPTLA